MSVKRTYWSKENCKVVSLRCEYLKELREKYDGAYRAINKNGWYDELCSHLKRRFQHPPYYWTKERCRVESLRHTLKGALSQKSGGAYCAIRKNGWYDELCSHLITFNSTGLKLNYAIEFPDNHVYVGITFDMKFRKRNHFNRDTSPVFRHIQKTGLKPKIIYDSLKPVDEALKKEVTMFHEYKKNGWVLLTKKLGGVGSITMKWTKERCHHEALKENNLTDFKKNCKGASDASYNQGWMDEITKHMTKRKPNGYWDNKENCRKEALKFNKFKELVKNNKSATFKILEHGWGNELYSHFTNRSKLPYNKKPQR